MAIIHAGPKNSGTEATIKVLAVLTEDVELVRGKILMSQFVEHRYVATKLSLFVRDDGFSYIGERNVWVTDVHEGVVVTFARGSEAINSLTILRKKKNWDEAFATCNRNPYSLNELNFAAEDIRNFLLFGIKPCDPISDHQKEQIDALLKRRDFDVLATFDFEEFTGVPVGTDILDGYVI